MFKHKFISAIALATILFVGYSCDEKDFYTFPEPSNTELTSMEVIRKDPDFANFVSVVDLCGEGCLDSLLNQERVYTLWAPVNETVNKDSLIECIEKGNRESVFTQFVKFHIANYRHPANGELAEDNKVMMVNGKYVTFSGNPTDGYKFGGNEIVEANILVKNGIIHKVGAPAKYIPSIWEALKSNALITTFWDYINSFTEKTFDRYSSTLGPIVNQQQTYLDSVFNESNEMLNNDRLCQINNEDSLYIVYVPTSEVWDRITEEAKSYFEFKRDEFTEEQNLEADTIQYERGANNYLKYFTFSMSEQRFPDGQVDFDNLPDTIYSKNTGPRMVVRSDRFNPIERIKMSNGELRILDYMPYKPTELWHDTITVEGEDDGLVRKITTMESGIETETPDRKGEFTTLYVSEKELNPIYKGEISKNNNYSYVLASPVSTTMPYVKYFVRDILSAKYKIAIVVIPQDIKVGAEATEKNSSSLRVTVAQNGEFLFEYPRKADAVGSKKDMYLKTIRPNMAAIDTIFLTDSSTGEDFVFDFAYCENFKSFTTRTFEDEDYTVEITVETAKPAKNRFLVDPNYEQKFRLDKIMLIPVLEEESEESGDAATE